MTPGNGWNRLLLQFENPPLLQTWNWGELKSRFGWRSHFLVWCQGELDPRIGKDHPPDLAGIVPDAVCLVLERQPLPGFSVMYAPKGPLLQDWADAELRSRVVGDLQAFARSGGALQLKIDPDLELGRGIPEENQSPTNPEAEQFQAELAQSGWIYSREQIQYRNTMLLNLKPNPDQLLSAMKSKTRYNIRLSERKGIKIRPGGKPDYALLYRMFASTSLRAGFAIRDEAYYRALWQAFQLSDDGPACQPLIAEYEGQPVAGAVIFSFGKRAWYLHGMSLLDHSEKMAPYLIQWQAINWAREQGCEVYDLWGAPDRFDESDPMWGVFRFKKGFGAEVVRTLGAWDYPAFPLRYRLYTRWLPRILELMRRAGRRQTEIKASPG